ncbi:MAG: hypothetical protein ABIY55_30965 [Kofleriaceae bacterium]
MGANELETARQRKLQAPDPDQAVPLELRRQLQVVHLRIDDVATLVRREDPGVAGGVARLVFEWSLLEAQLEHMAPLPSTREATRGLWASPSLEHARQQLRRLLSAGVVYCRRPGSSFGLIAQVYALAVKLSSHVATLQGLRAGSSSMEPLDTAKGPMGCET